MGAPRAEQVAGFKVVIAVLIEGWVGHATGATAGDVARAGQRRQEELGFPWKGVFGLGHGLGLGWDSPGWSRTRRPRSRTGW